MPPKKNSPEYEAWIKTPEYERWRERNKKALQQTVKNNIKNPEWIRNNKKMIINRSKNPEWRNNIKKAAIKRSQDPEWLKNNKNASIKRSQNPEWIRNNKEHLKKLCENPEWQLMMKERNQNLSKNPQWMKKFNEGMQKRNKNPEWRTNIKKSAKLRWENPEYIENLIGGFWYGAVHYPDRTIYCELWNRDLWNRIDAFWDYKSSLSGLTKEDNKDKNGKCVALSRHHVYYQPKACCEWDEDKQGYYAWINIGTNIKPNWYKHYINGDPNKFVLLTSKEHGQVGYNKLKWVKIFEDIIEQRGGKSYLIKEK
jgi:hypothetical protein